MEDEVSNIPIPDPSTLTYRLINDSVAHLKELLLAEITRVEERLDAYQESHTEVHAHRIAEVQAEIRQITELTAERFKGISDTGVERDARLKDAAQYNKDAINAALTAQKEMQEKTEKGFTKQIDSLGDQVRTMDKARDEQIRALERQVEASGGTSSGLNTAVNRVLSGSAVLISLVVAIVLIVRG